MSKKQAYLSKSNYMSGLQCEKLLWYKINKPKEIPPPSDDTKAIFAQGHEVGGLAQKLYPTGTEIKWTRDFAERIKYTQTALKNHQTLFEPWISHENCVALVGPTQVALSSGQTLTRTCPRRSSSLFPLPRRLVRSTELVWLGQDEDKPRNSGTRLV